MTHSPEPAEVLSADEVAVYRADFAGSDDYANGVLTVAGIIRRLCDSHEALRSGHELVGHVEWIDEAVSGLTWPSVRGINDSITGSLNTGDPLYRRVEQSDA